MIITVDDFRKNHQTDKDRDWIISDVLQSIPQEQVETIRQTRQVEVKFVINGVEVEPGLLASLYNNVEKYIDEQAEYLMKKKFEELEEKMYKIMQPLEDVTKQAMEKIKEEFNIKDDE